MSVQVHHCNRSSLWYKMLAVVEFVHTWGPKIYERLLYCLLNFAMNLKLL